MSERKTRSLLVEQRSRFVGYVRKRLSDLNVDPEDVVQDVLVKILERPDRPAPEFLTAYVFRSLGNRMIDLRRSRKNTVSIDEVGSLFDILEDRGVDMPTQLASDQEQQALFAALDALSEIERRVVISHDLEGHTFADLAQAWDIPTNTLLSHKSRALKKLRKQLSRTTI